MAIAINWQRSKLDLTLAQVNNSTLSNPVEGAQVWDLNLRLDAVAIDETTTAAVSGTSGTAILTLDAGTFSNGEIRVGDLVTGPAGVPVGAAVLSVDSDTQVTLDANLTGNVTSETLTLNAGGTNTVDASIAQFRIAFTPGQNQVILTPTTYLYDGSKTAAAAGGTDSPDPSTDASQTITLSSQTIDTIAINLDDFLSNLRVARTNT